MKAESLLIKMSQIGKAYSVGKSNFSVLSNIDLAIESGDFVSIEGPSGGGKSTLLSIIGLLDKATSGSYELCGLPVTQLTESQMAQVRNKEIGFIFQDFNLIGDLTVADNVALPLLYRKVNSRERAKLVSEMLEKVNLADKANHFPAQLSGGQQQRVAVARAVVGKPSLLLADEPTGNLDSVNGDAVMHLLKSLNSEGVTICMVTHDSRYSSYAKNTVKLFDGKIVHGKESIILPVRKELERA